jgi:hypothetical protein
MSAFWNPLCQSAAKMHDWQMARLEDLDDWTEVYLQYLKETYYETDPNKGEDAEVSKLEFARLAIEKFWYLHGKLLSWAQAHIT